MLVCPIEMCNWLVFTYKYYVNGFVIFVVET